MRVASEEKKSSSILYSHNHGGLHNALLATALVVLKDNQGNRHNVRAILDPGSQSSLITTRLCKNLKIQASKIQMTIDAINGMSSKIEQECDVELLTHYNNYRFQLRCLVIPEITGHLPTQHIDVQRCQIPPNIKLADPSFYVPGKVNILMGADCFWSLLCVGQLMTDQNQLMLQKTKLGWVAVGPLKDIYARSVRCNLSRTSNIDQELTKFWEIEEIGNDKVLSSDERDCKEHFARTTYRDQDGRFVVSIPFRKDPRELDESKNIELSDG